MIEELLKIVSKELGTELTLKIVFLHKRYGQCLTVEQYSELFGIKPSTVFKQISDETVAIKPTKVGRTPAATAAAMELGFMRCFFRIKPSGV